MTVFFDSVPRPVGRTIVGPSTRDTTTYLLGPSQIQEGPNDPFQISLAGWVRWDAIPPANTGGPIAVSNLTGEEAYIWRVTGSELVFNFRIDGGGFAATIIADKNTIVPGRWYHLAAVRRNNPGYSRAYLDGELVFSNTQTRDNKQGVIERLIIAGGQYRATSPTYPLTGATFLPAIWFDTVLTDQEVRLLADGVHPGDVRADAATYFALHPGRRHEARRDPARYAELAGAGDQGLYKWEPAPFTLKQGGIVDDVPVGAAAVELQAADLDGAPTLGETFIFQVHGVSAADVTSSPTLGEPSISVSGALNVDDLAVPSTLGEAAIIQTHALGAVDLNVPATLDELLVTRPQSLTPDALTVPATLDEPLVDSSGALFPAALTVPGTLGLPGVSSEATLAAGGLTVAPTLGLAFVQDETVEIPLPPGRTARPGAPARVARPPKPRRGL